MTSTPMSDLGLHIMVVVEPLHGSDLDWRRMRREAGERSAVISLLDVSGSDARWLVPAGPAVAASPSAPRGTGSAAATAGAGAAVIDKLFEAQALVPTIQRTEIRLFGGGVVESELADALHAETTIRVTVFDQGAFREARSAAPSSRTGSGSAAPTRTGGTGSPARPATSARVGGTRAPARPGGAARVGGSTGAAAVPSPAAVPSSAAPAKPRRARTNADRILAWIGAATLTAVALVIAVPLTVTVLAEQTPVGTLADGAEWGPTLGAEAQRAEGVSRGGTGLEQMLAIDPSTRTAYVSSSDGIRAADAEDIEDWSLSPVQLDNGTASITLSPDKTRAYLTGGTGGDSPGELIAFTVEGGVLTETYRVPLPGAGNMGEDAAVSPDGSRLYVADINTGFWVISTADGSLLANPFGGMASEVAVNPVDGTVAVGAPMDDVILLLDPTGTVELGRLKGGGGLPDAVVYSPDGTLLAVGANETVTVYEAGETHGRIVLSADIAGLAFSPSSAELAALTSGTEDTPSSAPREGIRLMDVASMTELTRIPLADSYILGDIAFTGAPGELLAVNGAVVRVDVSASRTNWVGYGIAIGLLGLVVLAAIITAAVISRSASPRRRGSST